VRPCSLAREHVLIFGRADRYEGQIASLQQQTFNMESAAMTTENLRNTMATVDAMKQANKEMKRQYGKLDIDKIEVSVLSDMLQCLIGFASRYITTWKT
jgi:hypothetical protein